MDKLSRVAREVDWVSGACMVIRRPDLEAVGLLDERYFMYNEDVDLCLAMKKRGRTVLYVAGAEVVHYRGKSAARNPAMERLRQQSHVAYYEKHLPRWTPLLRAYLKVTGKA
jgi:GT2 family glycosyltransferase